MAMQAEALETCWRRTRSSQRPSLPASSPSLHLVGTSGSGRTLARFGSPGASKTKHKACTAQQSVAPTRAMETVKAMPSLADIVVREKAEPMSMLEEQAYKATTNIRRQAPG